MPTKCKELKADGTQCKNDAWIKDKDDKCYAHSDHPEAVEGRHKQRLIPSKEKMIRSLERQVRKIGRSDGSSLAVLAEIRKSYELIFMLKGEKGNPQDKESTEDSFKKRVERARQRIDERS